MRMITTWALATWALAFGFSGLAVAIEPVNEQGLSATQIVEKNVAARGGLDAWRKVQSMVWIGHIEGANVPETRLPFALEMKRPNKTRFEVKAQGQTSVRMYDGAHGWKVRPSGNGRPDVQPYSPDELRFARDGQVIDGPLMDYQAKGIAVVLEGIDDVEGHKAYRLSVKLPSGNSHHVWVDAKTFLDIKYDRIFHNKFGQPGSVAVFYRNYQTIEGLQIPLMIESGADTGKVTEKLVIDKVSLNLPLEDRMFAQPGVPGRRSMAPAGINSPRAGRQMDGSALSMPAEMPRFSPQSVPGSGATH
jgi:hypothetical protein